MAFLPDVVRRPFCMDGIGETSALPFPRHDGVYVRRAAAMTAGRECPKNSIPLVRQKRQRMEFDAFLGQVLGFLG